MIALFCIGFIIILYIIGRNTGCIGKACCFIPMVVLLIILIVYGIGVGLLNLL